METSGKFLIQHDLIDALMVGVLIDGNSDCTSMMCLGCICCYALTSHQWISLYSIFQTTIQQELLDRVLTIIPVPVHQRPFPKEMKSASSSSEYFLDRSVLHFASKRLRGPLKNESSHLSSHKLAYSINFPVVIWFSYSGSGGRV